VLGNGYTCRMTLPLFRRAKLRQPVVPLGNIARDALFPRPLPTVLALSAPSGYGKTTALAQLRDASRLPTVWVHLDAADTSAAMVFAYVLEGIRAHAPYIGRSLEGLLASGAEPLALASAMLAELEEACLPGLLLVFDDVHLLGEVHPMFLAIEFWLDKLPAGVHLALASRHKLPFALARLVARGQALELDAARLAFDVEEQIRFWQAAGGLPAGLAEPVAALAGWPLGLWLIATREASTRSLEEVLYEESLDALTPEERGWLERLTIFEVVDLTAVLAVFEDLPPSRTLEVLVARHLLVPAVGESSVYRLAPLLAEALAVGRDRRVSATQWEGWHRAAGHYFAGRNAEAALEHFLAIGDELAALALTTDTFVAMWAGGRVEAIARWLARLSPARLDEHPAALRWRGRLTEREGDLEGAERLYRLAEVRAEAAGDQAETYAALARLGGLQASRGDDHGLLDTLERAWPLAAGGRAGDRCDLLLAQALIAEKHGSLPVACAYHREVLLEPLGDDPDVAHAHGVALLNLAGDAVNRGDHAAARDALTPLLSLVARYGLFDLHAPARLYQGILAMQTVDWQGVAAALEALPASWEVALSWQDAGLARELAAALSTARLEWLEARSHLEGAREIYTRAGYAPGLRGVSDGEIRLAGRQGLLVAARKRFEAQRPLRLDDPHDAQLQLTFATVLATAGESAEAAALLAELAAHLPSDRKHTRCRAELVRALVTSDASQLARTANAQLAELLALVADEPSLYAPIASLLVAVPEGALPLAELQLRFGPPEVRQAALAAGAFAPEQRLDVRCFGAFEVRLGGQTLDDFGRGKARVLLAALVLFPRGVHRLDLAQMLYGSEPAAEQNLRSVVSALRKALEPALASRAPSRYLSLEDERYRLAPGALGSSDVVAFEAAWAAAEQAHTAGQGDVQEAAVQELAALYRGELLSESVFEGYFAGERERFRREALHALGRLGAAQLEARRHTAALGTLARLVALDALAEAPVLLLIRTQVALGAPELARFAYWDLRNRLKALGERPSEEFEQAYRELVN
jgi:ATP/maltotriose-dependent transcriptional regulator MalT/DNA-binding SARP family transcriptional activator